MIILLQVCYHCRSVFNQKCSLLCSFLKLLRRYLSRIQHHVVEQFVSLNCVLAAIVIGTVAGHVHLAHSDGVQK